MVHCVALLPSRKNSTIWYVLTVDAVAMPTIPKISTATASAMSQREDLWRSSLRKNIEGRMKTRNDMLKAPTNDTTSAKTASRFNSFVQKILQIN